MLLFFHCVRSLSVNAEDGEQTPLLNDRQKDRGDSVDDSSDSDSDESDGEKGKTE